MRTLPSWLLTAFIAIALLGFVDAAYLTTEHLRGTVPPCTIVNGCEAVLTSKYAAIAGVPVSALGMLYYGAVLLLLIAYLDSRDWRIMQWAARLTLAGMAGSLYFVFVQAFILSAYCLYCMGSAVTSTLLFLIGLRIIYLNSHAD